MVRTKELKGQPRLGPMMARAVATSVGRGGAVPDLEVVRRDVTVDPAALADYNRVCGLTLRNALPSTYLHVLTFPLQVALFADRSYPYPLTGSVHLANRITQHRPVLVDEQVRLSVHAEPARTHRRGATVDVIGAAYVGDELVWDGRSTYLYRGQKAPSAAEGSGGRAGETPALEPLDGPGTRWRLPSDLGRAYAAASGDVNPIHLNKWTAKALGFPRTIAHGMWSAARMLGMVENRVGDGYVYDVSFRKPVLLPSTVRCVTQQASDGWDLTLRSDKKDIVHAVASVRSQG